MQSALFYSRILMRRAPRAKPWTFHFQPTRQLSILHCPPKTPWFVDPNEEIWDLHPDVDPDFPVSPPAPADAPHHLHLLHQHLVSLPLLEPSTVQIARSPTEPLYDPPPLPYRKPQGKRRRGGTPDAGEGVGDPPPLWTWIVLAQIKRGTEGKGSIDTVIRSARNVVCTFFFVLFRTSYLQA